MPRVPTSLPTGALILFVTLFAALLDGCGDKFAGLRDTELNVDLDKVPFPQERVLSGPGTYKYDLSQLVGHALFLEKDAQGQCQSSTAQSYDALTLSPESYVKPDIKLESQTINNLIYDRKVSKGGGAEFSVLGVGGSISDSNVAQLTIVETAFLNYRDNDLLSNWRQLTAEAVRLTGCPALLVRGATVRVVTAKYFARLNPKMQAEIPLTGSVFKANGQIFRETNGFETETLVSLTAYLLRPNQQPIEEVAQTANGPAPTAPDTTVFPKAIRVPVNQHNFRAVPKTFQFRQFLERRKILPQSH